MTKTLAPEHPGDVLALPEPWLCAYIVVAGVELTQRRSVTITFSVQQAPMGWKEGQPSYRSIRLKLPEAQARTLVVNLMDALR